nr:immunoglobulin light chain junction region [Macaca mulatta]MOW18723.1 immunoglobulin light chain junction region [Macaca mulatta]MOY16202.1 immunoglobulin light chain junction region [Macaca mulatta]
DYYWAIWHSSASGFF